MTNQMYKKIKSVKRLAMGLKFGKVWDWESPSVGLFEDKMKIRKSKVTHIYIRASTNSSVVSVARVRVRVVWRR